MKTLVTIGLAAGAGAGLFTAIDNMIRPKEKTWVNDKMANMYIWLDDQKNVNIIHVFLKNNIQKITRIAIYVLGVLSCLGWLGTILEEEA